MISLTVATARERQKQMAAAVDNSAVDRRNLSEGPLSSISGDQFERWMKRHLKKILPNWFIAIRRHRKKHGQFPRLIRPQTFNEKVLHRMLFDRRPILTQVADKAAVRDFVEERLGRSFLPECYHLTGDPETIPFDKLPVRFVVKPTHGSGWVEIVADKTTLDQAALKELCRSWLRQSFYEITREWVYKHIQPRIIVEQFIEDASGETPNDYKFFVFGGTVQMVQVDAGRFTDHRRRLYSPTWEKLPFLLEYDDINGDVPRPRHLKEMIAAAETLAKGFDFIRADFYDTPDCIYFGELTTTPGCGTSRFRPKEFDRHLGLGWKLPA
jgi:TupA-like ATPgrasp